MAYAAAVLAGVGQSGRLGAAPVYCCLVVTLAGALLPPRRVLFLFLFALSLLPALALLARRPDGHDAVRVSELFFAAVVLCTYTAAVTTISATVLQRALVQAHDESRRARSLTVQLSAVNAELEARVQERTSDLADALRAQGELARQLHELSVRDELTGLHNRRHLDRLLARLFTEAREAGRALSVAVLDIDDFKRINDTLCHGAGDEVLRRVAKVLRAETRPVDVVARYGGEEFVLLLPDTDLREAAAICERVRAAVTRSDMSDIHPELRVTVSLGVAGAAGVTTAGEQLDAADQLLYRAKRKGKNQIQVGAAPTAGLTAG